MQPLLIKLLAEVPSFYIEDSHHWKIHVKLTGIVFGICGTGNELSVIE